MEKKTSSEILSEVTGIPEYRIKANDNGEYITKEGALKALEIMKEQYVSELETKISEHKQILREAQVLTGDDAKRFNEAMENPKSIPQQELDRMKYAYNLIQSKSPFCTERKLLKFVRELDIESNDNDWKSDKQQKFYTDEELYFEFLKQNK